MSKGNSKHILTDKKILEQIRNGDPMGSMDVLYEREFPKLKNYIINNSGSDDDARDIFQEVVMILFTHVKSGKFKEEYDIGAFMFSVGRNAWKKQSGKAPKTIEIDNEITQVKEAEGLYEQIFDEERRKLIDELLGSVGENCKKIFKLVIFEKKSMKEVTQIMDYQSETTTRTRHYKCKQKLIKKVKENPRLAELLKDMR